MTKTILYTGNFFQTYITQMSVRIIKGRKTAKTNLAGRIKSIIGTPKPPKLPPNPDLEMETTKTQETKAANTLENYLYNKIEN